MILKLLVKSGPYAGKQIDLKAGAIIGRSSQDIHLDDAKLSGKHAKIETDPAGNWILTDLGSTNGIKVNGKRLAQVPLTTGLVFHLGSTDLEVISTPDPEIAQSAAPPLPTKIQKKIAPAPETEAPSARIELPLRPETKVESTVEPTVEPATEATATQQATGVALEAAPPTWSEYLSSFAIRAQEKVKNHPENLKPFDPLLVLSIQRGPQIGTTWVLGYGPREVGIESIDLPLLDTNAPPIAFTITPKGAFGYFETVHPKRVRLNNKSVSAETLRGDDKITVGDTVIHVSYRE